MPYSVDKYSGSTIAVVEDGTINNSLDIKLIGKNYAGYGEAQNENFVWLLENFAGNSAPARPITGQLWYDNLSKRLKVFTGTSFKNTSGFEYGEQEPQAAQNGEFWYDTAESKLKVWSEAENRYLLIGPQRVVTGATQVSVVDVRELVDIDDVSHPVIMTIIEDEVVSIISNSDFELDTDPGQTEDRFIPGFRFIKRGLTLRGVNDYSVGNEEEEGISSTHFYWGTASDSLRLGGLLASEYATKADANFTELANFADAGFLLGDGQDLEVKIDIDGLTPIIKNRISDTIKFYTTNNSTSEVYSPLTLFRSDLLPGVTELSNIGSDTLKFNTVYALNFSGLASRSSLLSVTGGTPGINDFVPAAVPATPYSIAARDANGDLTAGNFIGTSSRANGLVVGGVTIPAANFVHVNSPVFSNTTSPVIFQDIGFKFGTTNKFRITATSDTLSFSTISLAPLTLKGADILPEVTNASNIGSSTLRYKDVYGTNFYGTFNGTLVGGVADNATNAVNAEFSDKASKLLVSDASNAYYNARVSKTFNSEHTIAVRTPAGLIDADVTGNAGTVTNGVYLIGNQTITGSKTFSAAVTGTAGFIGNVTGNVTGNVIGNVTGNVTGNVFGNADTATYAATAGSAPTSGTANTALTVTQGAQPAITSVGTLTGLNVNGPITAQVGNTFDIGTSGRKFNDIHCNRLFGDVTGNITGSAASAANADRLRLGSAYREAALTASGSTIAARDGSGNITANLFIGTATAARYADLAEKYLTDVEYSVGTVISIGGTAEATAAKDGDKAIGVISENPAFMMNSELESGQYVALKGRVPVRVVGSVSKGDRLVSTGAGVARVARTLDDRFNVFGIALETSLEDHERLVETVIL